MSDRKRSMLSFAAGVIPFAGKYILQGEIHSPEIFSLKEFLNKQPLLSDDKHIMSEYRFKLKQDVTSISFEHPVHSNVVNKRICDIAAGEGKSVRRGKLLYKLVKYFRPVQLLETGTSLGLSLMYQALAMPAGSTITSLEGAVELHEYTRKVLVHLSGKNVQLVQGRLPDALKAILKEKIQIDWVFLDADHRYESLKHQFSLLLPYLYEGSVVVIDDIRWSQGMTKAWSELSTHSAVSHSIDFYDMGVLLFKKNTASRKYYLIS